MKYPRLKDKDNLAKKLSEKHIEELQETYQSEIQKGYSPTSIRNKLAQHYNVSYSTIYYWTSDNYRKEKRIKNSQYWTNMKSIDYDKWLEHKTKEIDRRRKRMKRNPELKLWHEVISAKNEKRVKRKTVKGKDLEDYYKGD